LTQEQLDAIEARLNDGEQWTPEECSIQVDPEDGYVWVPECSCLGDTIIQLGGHYENFQADWVFCANARQDMRLLLEEVKRLRQEYGGAKLPEAVGRNEEAPGHVGQGS